jgi:hypothetical protein
MPRAKGTPRRAGRKSVWGPRSPVTIKFPVAHRDRYEREAAAKGMSLNEYVIRELATSHGLVASSVMEGGQLALGA